MIYLLIKKLKYTILPVLLVLGNVVYTQNQGVIEGTVKDADGKPITFANVQVEGTTIGVATNANGFFRILVPWVYVCGTASMNPLNRS